MELYTLKFYLISLVRLEFRHRLLEHDLLFTAIDCLSNFVLEDVTNEHLETIFSFWVLRCQQKKNWNALKHIVMKMVSIKMINWQNYVSTKYFFKSVRYYLIPSAIATFGYSPARCQSSFSAISRILSKLQQSINFRREAHLTLL